MARSRATDPRNRRWTIRSSRAGFWWSSDQPRPGGGYRSRTYRGVPQHLSTGRPSADHRRASGASIGVNRVSSTGHRRWWAAQGPSATKLPQHDSACIVSGEHHCAGGTATIAAGGSAQTGIPSLSMPTSKTSRVERMLAWLHHYQLSYQRQTAGRETD